MRAGGEEAFARGLHPRELPAGGAPLRWTGAAAAVVFERLPELPLELTLSLPGRRGAVLVGEGGRILGRLPAEQRTASYSLAPGPAHREITLSVEAFVAGDGRTLGTQLDRVGVSWPRGIGWPRFGLVGLLWLAGLGVAIGARRAGGSAGVVGFASGGGVAVAVALLWPVGLAFSPVAPWLAAAVAAAGVAAGEVARRLAPGAGTAALELAAALFVVAVAFGPLAASPAMVVSDAVFQANKLTQVARGDLFPVSVTQHQPPFRFPYGVAFFALLAPLARAGFEPVTVVRCAAALATVLAAFAWVAVLIPSGARAAAIAGLALAVTPIAFDVFSYGNLANVFAQAATLGLLAWWIGPTPGGLATGAALAALAGLSHLSGALVLFPLALALALFDRRGAGDVRWRALALGLAVSFAYYASFLPLIVSQLGRLGEGGGGGGGLLDGLLVQVAAVLAQLGLPLIALAAFAELPPADTRAGAVARAGLATALALGLASAVSPLQPRYVYALTGVVALLAGRGAMALHARGRAGTWAAAALVGLAVLRGGANLVDAVLARYRAG